MTAVVLAIDSSTYVGTVAVIRRDEVVAERSVAMRGERTERLMPAVVEALDAAGVMVSELTGIACGGGPGSFTSLRIAAAIAKGMSVALGTPLIAASSLTLVVAGIAEPLPAGRYIAALDAMRGELFAQEISVRSDGRIEEIGAFRRAARAELESWAHDRGATLLGPGEPRQASPQARGFARLLGTPLARDVAAASWEPEYGRKAEAQVKWEAKHGRELADA